MLKITLPGTPYEMGFQHGESLYPLVNAKVIEKAPKSFHVRNSEGRSVYVTNSFVHAGHSHYMGEDSDGFNRNSALGKLLSESQLNERSLKTISSNKEGDYPICHRWKTVSRRISRFYRYIIS